jgi:phytoene synthase
MTALSARAIEDLAAQDPDRVLASAFAPPDSRPAILALIAFEHEIAKVREATSEPALGAIRLQWWRDALDEISEGRAVRRHPVALALAEAIETFDLPDMPFREMIDARLLDFEEAPFATWEAQEEYGAATAGNLTALCALACGLGALTAMQDRAARRAGAAWSQAGLMRALPVWASRRSTPFPVALEAELGLDRERLFAGKVDPALGEALRAMAAMTRENVAGANSSLFEAGCGEAFAAFAHVTLASPYARRVAASPDPFRRTVELSLLGRQSRLVWAVARGRL